MYSKGEYEYDLRIWQKELGNLSKDFEGIRKQLEYQNIMDTLGQLRCFAHQGIIDYSEEEYASDVVDMLLTYHKINLRKELKKKESLLGLFSFSRRLHII